jgi:hypothetical protein
MLIIREKAATHVLEYTYQLPISKVHKMNYQLVQGKLAI